MITYYILSAYQWYFFLKIVVLVIEFSIYTQVSLFMVVILYKVLVNPDLANTKPAFLTSAGNFSLQITAKAPQAFLAPGKFLNTESANNEDQLYNFN